MQLKAVFAILIGLFAACMPSISHAVQANENVHAEYALISSAISTCNDGIIATPVTVAQDLPVALRAPSVAEKFSVAGCLPDAYTADSKNLFSNLSWPVMAGCAYPLYLFHSVLLI